MTDEQCRTWSENLAHLRKKIERRRTHNPCGCRSIGTKKTLLTEAGGNQDKMDRRGIRSDDETCFLLRIALDLQVRYALPAADRYGGRKRRGTRRRSSSAGSSAPNPSFRGHLEYDNPYNPFWLSADDGCPDYDETQVRGEPRWAPLYSWEPPSPTIGDYVAGLDAASGADGVG